MANVKVSVLSALCNEYVIVDFLFCWSI